MSNLSDHLSPIVVKESRQAIKSRQFLITFGLLLVGAWVFTFAAIAAIGPGIYFNAHGPDLFMGYFLMLGFCTLVVVPCSTGRSLSSEREDGSYELLSITTMGPHHIVAGKLASGLMQSLLYFSVLAPCLAFTYLLQGVALPTIAYVLAATFLSSMLLTMLGLAVATLSKDRHWNLLLTGGMAFATMYAYFGLSALVSFALFETGLPFSDSRFWVANLAGLTAYVTLFAVLFFATAAQLNFTSANRSTPLRIAIFVQFAAWTGWAAVWFFHYRPREATDEIALLAYLMVSAGYWALVGMFLTNESAELSPRVRRRLPQSSLGRLFLTGFNPGPGSGLLFSLAGAATAGILAIVMLIVVRTNSSAFYSPYGTTGPYVEPERFFQLVIVGFAYLVFFLSVGYGLTQWGRRALASLGRLPSMPVHVLLLLGLSIGGLFIHWGVHQRNVEHSGWLWFNPATTMYSLSTVSTQYQEWSLTWTVVIVPAAALIAFLAIVPMLADEIRQTRMAVPERILEEDALKHPPPIVLPQPLSPWDRDDVEE